jgi:hypothetical protein
MVRFSMGSDSNPAGGLALDGLIKSRRARMNAKHQFKGVAFWIVLMLVAWVLGDPLLIQGKFALAESVSGQPTQAWQIAPGQRVQVKLLGMPPRRSAEELEQLIAQSRSLKGPDLPEAAKGGRTAAPISAAESHLGKGFQPGSSAPEVVPVSQFDTMRLTFLGASGTHGFYGTTSVVGSPSAASNGYVVFQTGNWFASLSTDGGKTFRYIDPRTAFNNTYGGFCCNQWVVYDPSRDLFLWLLLYAHDASQGSFKLAAATTAQVARGQWMVWDFPAGNDRQWENLQLEVTPSYAYLSANQFNLAGNTFLTAIVMRVPLDDLFTGGALNLDAYMTSNFAPHLANGTGNIMFFASHNSTSQIRIFQWSQLSTTVDVKDVDIPAWTDQGYTCISPDGSNWCGSADGRIQTGWMKDGTETFMWNAAGGGSFLYPYIDAVRLNTSDLSIVSGIQGQPLIYNTSNSFLYPSAVPNARGDIGLAFYYSNNTTDPTRYVYPSLVGSIWDDFSTPPPGWQYYLIVAGKASPAYPNGSARNVWGNYLSTRPFYPNALAWQVGGSVLDGCGYDGGDCAKPFYAIFGRERDRNSVETSSRPPYGPRIWTPLFERK